MALTITNLLNIMYKISTSGSYRHLLLNKLIFIFRKIKLFNMITILLICFCLLRWKHFSLYLILENMLALKIKEALHLLDLVLEWIVSMMSILESNYIIILIL
jgi:hypothetical protein